MLTCFAYFSNTSTIIFMLGVAKYFQHVEVQAGCKTMAKQIDFKRKYFGYTLRSTGKTKHHVATKGFLTHLQLICHYLPATDMRTLFTSPVVGEGPHCI
jgi:hypothetical protein